MSLKEALSRGLVLNDNVNRLEPNISHRLTHPLQIAFPHLGGKRLESFARFNNSLICRFLGSQDAGTSTPHPFATYAVPGGDFRGHA